MSRRSVIAGAAAVTVGAAVLLPLPAQSSTPVAPPSTPSLVRDYLVPPPDMPKTRMPWEVNPRGSTTYKRGLYDVHVLVVATDDGPPPWDEAEARRQVEQMDRWYSSETSGNFRFRLAGLHVLPQYPGSLCGVDDALAHAGPEIAALTRTPEAIDVLPVVVGASAAPCPAAGEAYLGAPGAWVSVDRIYSSRAAKVLHHEIGHNLGLLHSAATPTVFTGDPWPASGPPSAEEEYGDASDIMGFGGQWACDYTQCIFNRSGLHGHNRNILGGVAPEQISFASMPQAADDSQVISLTSEESGEAGVQLVYLPWKNRSMFMLEYRPALGQDRYIADEYGPGAGVHVRLVGARVSAGPPPYPEQSLESAGTVAFPAGRPAGEGWSTPIGFKPGQSVTLPDGTKVEVLSAAGNQASVRVTRPADTSPPAMSTPRIEYSAGACTRYPCTVPASVAKKGKYRLWIAYGAFSDDQWVASAVATVNGVETLVDERPTPDGTDEEGPLSHDSRDWGAWRTYAPGSYTVTYTYRDLSGNEGTSSYQVVLPKPKKR